jgi:hypothetical protein
VLKILTRREKIVLALAGILLVLFIIFPQLLDPNYETIYLLFVVLPLGILLVTDKQRVSHIDSASSEEGRGEGEA